MRWHLQVEHKPGKSLLSQMYRCDMFILSDGRSARFGSLGWGHPFNSHNCDNGPTLCLKSIITDNLWAQRKRHMGCRTGTFYAAYIYQLYASVWLPSSVIRWSLCVIPIYIKQTLRKLTMFIQDVPTQITNVNDLHLVNM